MYIYTYMHNIIMKHQNRVDVWLLWRIHGRYDAREALYDAREALAKGDRLHACVIIHIYLAVY